MFFSWKHFLTEKEFKVSDSSKVRLFLFFFFHTILTTLRIIVRIAGNDHFGQKLGTKNMKNHVHDTLSVMVLQTKVL